MTRALEITSARNKLKEKGKSYLAGDKAPLQRLGYNFVLWARDNNICPRYHSPLYPPGGRYPGEQPPERSTLTDTEAALVDEAISTVRVKAPAAWEVFFYVYFRGWSPDRLSKLHKFNRFYAEWRAKGCPKRTGGKIKIADFYQMVLDRFFLLFATVLTGEGLPELI